MPTVSVIIPTYNRAAYLPACVESVFAQTFGDYEIIVADDGSTDNTREVLAPWIQAKRIRYIHQENKGPAAARNAALRLAAGEMIACLDSDDLWPPDKLEWQVRFLREHSDVGVVGGGHLFIDEHGSNIGYPVLREGGISFEDAITGTIFVSVGATLIRCQVIHEAGGFDEACWGTEDLDFWLTLARTGCRIARFPKLAILYRFHPANLSGDILPMYEKCELVIRKHLASLASPERTRLTPRAYAWLYDYRGERVVLAFNARLWKGDFSDLSRLAGILARLFPAAVHDRTLFRRLCKDLFVPFHFRAKTPRQ
jgi:glycosyltransferase involved in cell wall biosynthesis